MPHFVENGLERWGGFIARHRRGVLLGAVLLAICCVPGAVYVARHLDSNVFNQVSDRLTRFRIMREFSEDFGGDVLAAVVTLHKAEAADPARVKELKAFADLLAAELAKVGTLPEDAVALEGMDLKLSEGPWLRHVECRAGEGLKDSLKELARKYPHAVLGPDEVKALAERFTPQELARRLEVWKEAYRNADPAGAERKKLQLDPLDLQELQEQAMEARLSRRGRTLAADDADKYFLSKDCTTLVVLSRPALSASNPGFNRALLEACQRAENRAKAAFRAREPAPALAIALKAETYGDLAEGEPENPPLAVGYTGMHAIAVENEASLRWDILSTTASSVISVLLLFLLVFRRIRLAVHIGITMTLALLATLTAAALIHGSIGVLGAGFPCILLGMGVDYGIHLYSTFHHQREELGASTEDALRRTLRNCGPGILAASLTTAVAFFGIATTHFRGLAELGLLSGLGLLFSALLMLCVFPALIAGGAKGTGHVAAPIRHTTVLLGRFHKGKRRGLAGLAVGAIILVVGGILIALEPDPGADTVLGVRFDAEFSNLRSLRVKAAPLRDRVAKKFGQGFADIRIVAEGDDEAQAFATAIAVRKRLEPYLERGDLKGSGGALDYVPAPDRQRDTLDALRALDLPACKARFLEAARQAMPKAREGSIEAMFESFLGNLDETATVVKEANILTLRSVLNGPLGPLLGSCARIDPESNHVQLGDYYFPGNSSFRQPFYDELAATLEAPMPQGRIQVTAAKMVGFELKESLFRDMEWISGAVTILVVVMLLVAFRGPKRALLAAMPLGFGLLFVLSGVALSQRMGWDLAINYVNLMIFPVLVGSGIDYGVYIVYDYYSDRRPALSEVIAETGRGVLLCALTTLAGFGSMIWGSYTGLISFGWTAILGYSGALFGAMIVLPALLGLLGRRNQRSTTR